ncbi:hypothetical protein [Mucilaginibacter sp.]|uniref:hypothetical protein n=1 Tax=Mucilaginibacter sp. TaxID=1882438 RepID=UPI003AFFD7A7
MKTSEIKKRLHGYIDSANEEKVKALYMVLESEVKVLYDHWDDPEFVAEMDSRLKEYKDGTAKSIPLEEVLFNAREMIKNFKEESAV